MIRTIAAPIAMNGSNGETAAHIAVAAAKAGPTNIVYAPLKAIYAGIANIIAAATPPITDTNPPKGPLITALITSPNQFKTLLAASKAGTNTGNNTSPTKRSIRPLAISICACKPSHECL